MYLLLIKSENKSQSEPTATQAKKKLPILKNKRSLGCRCLRDGASPVSCGGRACVSMPEGLALCAIGSVARSISGADGGPALRRAVFMGLESGADGELVELRRNWRSGPHVFVETGNGHGKA
ncbi:hypothetical protein IAD21_03726 [Abditibacteriota bacterium]|nr:hypothetical protein IAD21_03726 [Abditibacteriota bacterium]